MSPPSATCCCGNKFSATVRDACIVGNLSRKPTSAHCRKCGADGAHAILLGMKQRLLPWTIAVSIGLLCALARYGLIQPVELAQQCDALSAPWWCTVRLWIIYSYAWYGLGYAAFVLALVATVWRNTWSAAAALACGFAALILYCYEPGAFAVVVGVVMLARSHSAGNPQPPWGQNTRAKQQSQ